MPLADNAFPWDETELRERLKAATIGYWTHRSLQAEKQLSIGNVSDAGSRSEVTGGKHLDGYVELICELVMSAGYEADHIRFKTGVDIPGYYRPMKKWDVVVVRENRLCAAVELKSQVGPSFGNNFNNRTEEAIGNSIDLWRAFQQGVLGAHAPWLGYFFLLESDPRSVKAVGIAKSVFEPDPVFRDTSYADRYRILCQRLVLERNYNAAALLLSPRGLNGDYSEPSPDLGTESFFRALHGHLMGCI